MNKFYIKLLTLLGVRSSKITKTQKKDKHRNLNEKEWKHRKKHENAKQCEKQAKCLKLNKKGQKHWN